MQNVPPKGVPINALSTPQAPGLDEINQNSELYIKSSVID